MERIQHFSHPKHSLILKKLGEKEVKCYGCQEAITENDNYYACEEEKEDCPSFINLHKKCADLPTEINLPIHDHPLTLFESPPYYDSTCFCNICRRDDWKWFTYRCSLCEFDIDVICCSILQDGNNNTLQHEAHPHPLTLNLRSALFHCDACDTKGQEDLSYFCNPCNFWIHKTCASAPKSITVLHHDDPLLLTYSLPLQHRNFEQICDICREKVHPSHWVYYCDNCRYFNHLKCATLNTPSVTGETEIQAQEGDREHPCELMQFPFPNPDSSDPLSVFIANNNTSGAYDNGETEIFHRLHDHPLTIHTNEADIPTNNLEAYNEIVCDGCVRPISVPFYSCSKCTFFLHCFCAHLPEEELQCPHDSGHSIKVKKYAYCYDFFECSLCLQFCSGLLCECVSCNLGFDIGCTSNLIPSRIKHDSHVHPLVRSHLPRNELTFGCNACGYYDGSSETFSCEACSFNLCLICINYRGSVRHEYDKHSIPLMYPPIKDHPSDFICEICEEDINPRYWMYHCQDCTQSFHTRCMPPADWYLNIKYGGKVSIGKVHQHPLTFVRNSPSEFATLCDQCGSDLNGRTLLECAPCGFKLCIPCARQFEA